MSKKANPPEEGQHRTAFGRALAAINPARGDRGGPGGRRWLYVPYDQLSAAMGPLSREPPAQVGIVLVECPGKAARRPYHKQKLALVLANTRHFALEQARRGVAVRHLVAKGPTFASALEPIAAELGPLRVMDPAERELRKDLEPLVAKGCLEVIEHEGWLTTEDDFDSAAAGPPWRMDAFYRLVRKRTQILMERGKPAGGKLSHDAENRQPWKGQPQAPTPPIFEADEVTLEVRDLVDERFKSHPGEVRPENLPATAVDAERLWAWAKRSCLADFGRFEDAMSTRSPGLFHTRISPLLNLHRLLPRRVVDDALALELPLASKEGFVRQILGWREFVRHVHRRTDGFRALPDGPAPLDAKGNAAPSRLGAKGNLPVAYWGTPSGLRCLDTVVADVWREAWSHHITRLMVLSNIALLLDVSPRQLTDWFWEAYDDAYDWVVEPNVLAMGTFGAGGVMTTKPYIAGAAYVNRMSDYCGGCAFDPKTTCPLTKLYWAFLSRHGPALEGNQRMTVPLRAAEKRDPARRREDAATFEALRDLLDRGELATPESLERAASTLLDCRP